VSEADGKTGTAHLLEHNGSMERAIGPEIIVEVSLKGVRKLEGSDISGL